MKGPHGPLNIARLIMKPAQGEAVKYKNGNRLDLRRCNMQTRVGRGGRRKDIVQAAFEQYPQDEGAQEAYIARHARRTSKGVK
jgi:hypothetical protein